MENLSHSRHPNRSKKACGNAAKSLYDDVYGGPPKSAAARTNLSPRAEDYGEIFGSFQASRASSIPVLDLPAVDEAEVFFDVRSSGFDYAEVFGGFEGLDFALSYEDLLDQAKAGRGNSSDEAWSPVEFESMSDESDTSGKDQYHTNGSPQQKFDGSTEFSISYHQAQQLGSEDVSNGMTHVAHLHAVPGFSYMVDSPSQQREGKTTGDGNLDLDFSAEMMRTKHLKKTMSHPPNGSACERAFENDPRPQKGYGKDGSSHGGTFVGISEISLRTQPSDLPPPSRPPPAAEEKKGDASKLVSKRNPLAFGGISGDCSPPFFDVEVDASSSAAVSAAAMKEAMEKAQAKLKSAKEFMEKKKEGLQSSCKLGSKKYTKEKAGETGKIIDGSNRLKDERVNSTFAREEGVTNVFAREEKKKASKTPREGRELLDREELISPSENNAKEKPEKDLWSSGGSYKIDEASEWKEATEFFELVTTDEPTKHFKQENSKKTFVQSIEIHEREQRANEAMESFEKQSGNSRKEKTATEDYKLGEFKEKEKGEELCGLKGNNAKLKEEKKASELKDRERKLKVTREVCELGESKKSSSMATQHAETNKNLAEADKSVKVKESKSKSKKAAKQKDNEQKMMGTDKVDEIEKQLKLFHENVDKEDTQRWAFGQDGSDNRLKEVSEQAGKETKVKKDLEQEENETWLKEILEKVESDRRPKEVVAQQENEKSLKRPLEQGKNKKKEKEKEAVDLEDGKRHDKTHEREETEERRESVSGDREIGKKAPEQGVSKGRSKLGPEKEEIEVEQLDTQNMSEVVLEREETKQVLKDAVESDVMKRLDKAYERIENDRNSMELKVDEGTCVHDEGEDLLQFNKTQKLGCSNNTQPIQSTFDIDESCGEAETPQEILSHEEMKDVKPETISNEVPAGIFGMESDYVDINLEASSIAENHHLKMDDAKEAIPIDAGVKNTSEDIEIKPEVSEKWSATFEMESVLVDEKLKAFGKSLETLDDQVKKTGEAGSVIGGLYAEKVKSCSPMGSDPEKQERVFSREWEEKGERPQSQASSNQEENKESTMPTQSVQTSFEDGRKMEASQPPRAEEMQKNQKSVQQVNASQATDRKEKISGEVEDERMNRAREMEKERIRKAEEERERDEKQNQQLQQGNTNQTTERKEKKSGGVEAERSKREREMESERARKIEEDKQKNQKAAQQVSVSQATGRRDRTSGEVETDRMRREREMENDRLRKIEEEKQKNQKSAQQINVGQTTERREKTLGEVETERMRRERELENERQRKIEEEREREREREKDRMAVDLATLEARERVFGESRERAERTAVERATVEARQRAMAEARERLEKACAEAREKSLAGKTAMDARIRAERAAVERATAEARERAAVERATSEARERAERAMAERAANEARERVQRSVSDKFSASARNSGLRQSSSSSDLQDLQFPNSGVPRYQYSSVYSERYEGVEGESAQRCKARLERHRRTAERAAKALAEKNMRDLLAQREQAERNRLAETLDADVRRWSSGKEGNLRALLSTLQYILGPDSGWQPIPLTDVITSAAVKKAYRKATLCVHPDKLQQRSASIQQKYVCEKVFDLLKEAWNKFNSEER